MKNITNAIKRGDFAQLSLYSMNIRAEQIAKETRGMKVEDWTKTMNRKMTIGEYKATLIILEEIANKLSKLTTK